MATEKKLEVSDLRISFKTTDGKVQAVRDISFDLYKGETLSIVGESGSGKSVTSRAILGILAGNAIKEGGKILYDGKDLMKIPEDEFHRIRGDKIAMVFQDPLSSLNPIMRVGKQLTEAMLLKNKASRKESSRALETMIAALSENMNAAGVSGGAESLARFKQFSTKHSQLQSAYRESYDLAMESLGLSETLLQHIDSGAIDNDFTLVLNSFEKAAPFAKSRFVIHEGEKEYDRLLEKIRAKGADAKKDSSSLTELRELVSRAHDMLKEAVNAPEPNTFSLGYYLTFIDGQIPEDDVETINRMTHDKTDADFMQKFMSQVEAAVKHSMSLTDDARRKAIDLLQSKLPLLEADQPEKNGVTAAVGEMKTAVARCLDPLEVVKDSLTHTFPSSIDYAVESYYGAFKVNEKEKRRFEKSSAKYEKLVAKGKTPEWEVVPASYVDTDAAHREISDIVREQIAHFEEQLSVNKEADTAERALEIVDYLKEQTQNASYSLTKRAAKENAIRLMEDVGIDNARKRYTQYPFEFSGGMRQRIVIAIALTANPDVLICDEPTTALDVTIQAQILELINNLKKKRNLSVIFITHDLGVVANMADRIAVMYAGKIVEYGTARDVFYEPAHPYTWALLSSVPDLDTKEKLVSIPGTPPNMIYPPKGDAFAERNVYAMKIDFEEQPPMFRISDTHYAATWLLHPDAPKVEMPSVIRERMHRMQTKQKEAAV